MRVLYELDFSSAGVKDSSSKKFQIVYTFDDDTFECLSKEVVYSEKDNYTAPDRAYGFSGSSESTVTGEKLTNLDNMDFDYVIEEFIVDHMSNQRHVVSVDSVDYEFSGCEINCLSHYGYECDCDGNCTWDDVDIPYFLKSFLTEDMNAYYASCLVKGDLIVMSGIDTGFFYKGQFVYFSENNYNKQELGQESFHDLVISNANLLPTLMENNDFVALLKQQVTLVDTWVQVVDKVASPVRLYRMDINIKKNAYWFDGTVFHEVEFAENEIEIDRNSCAPCQFNPKTGSVVFKYYLFVSVIDSSKQTEHWIPVPPTIKSAQQAIAWTFSMTANEYVVAKNT